MNNFTVKIQLMQPFLLFVPCRLDVTLVWKMSSATTAIFWVWYSWPLPALRLIGSQLKGSVCQLSKQHCNTNVNSVQTTCLCCFWILLIKCFWSVPFEEWSCVTDTMTGAATSIIFVAPNTCLSQQNMSFASYDKTCHLLWQKYACHNKTFVVTNIFLSQQNTSFVTTKHVNCYEKSMLVTTKLLLWQTYFVATNIFCCKKSFVATSMILSWKKFCCDKLTFVTANMCLLWQNTSFVVTNVSWQIFVETKVFSWQTRFCCVKSFVAASITNVSWQIFVETKVFSWQTHFCCLKSFVAASILLSRQKLCFVMTNACGISRQW